MSPLRWFIGVSLIILMACAIGCGPGTYPVDGQVVYADGGQPFPGGRIEIELENADIARRANASADIDAEGRFKLQALEGKHRVLLLPPMPPPNTKSPKPLAPLNARHRSYDHSGLTIDVSRDASKNKVKLEVAK